VKLRMFVLAVLVVFAAAVQARASCDEEDIDTVSSDGEIIELLDGSVWRSLDPARGYRLKRSSSAMMM